MTAESSKLNRECPQCGRRMVFTPDGRALVCESCNTRREVESKRATPAEIAALRQFMPGAAGETSKFRTNVRDLLVQGIAAVKAGDVDEAHFYLEWVLRKNASEAEQAEAWLWLSELYADPADKRECLAQVLALQPGNALARRGLAILDGRLKPEEIVDPDALGGRTAAEPGEARATQFNCPRCNAPMNYAPDGRQLLCEFCGYRQELTGEEDSSSPVDELRHDGLEQDFFTALATARGHLKPVATRLLQCQGCGVSFALAPETLSVTCPYCHSVYVTEAAETQEIMPPQALIPFDTSEDDALQALRAWFKRYKFERPRVTPLIGVYLPAWTFDLSGPLPWSGVEQKGENWVPVSGEYFLLHHDLVIPAGDKLPGKLSRIFRDFDLEQLVEYDARYLADWPAERYQIALADASIRARGEILRRLRREPVKVVGARDVQNLRISSRGMVIDSFKLILLPVWMAHYQVEGRRYGVVINGKTGRVFGDREEGVVEKFFSWFRGE